MSQGGTFRRELTIYNTDDGNSATPVDDEMTFTGSGPVKTTSSGSTITTLLKNSDAAVITEISTDGTLADDSDVKLASQKAVKTYVDNSTPTVNLSDFVFGGLVASFYLNTTTATAPINYRDFGNLEFSTRAYNTGTTEYSQSEFRCPDDVDPSGTVTFEISGAARTAASSKNVKFTFDFIEAGDGDVLTGAYGTAQAWDDQSISGTQDAMDILSNTATVSDLGLEAGKRYFWRLYRSAATTNDLATYYDVIDFVGTIPRI